MPALQEFADVFYEPKADGDGNLVLQAPTAMLCVGRDLFLADGKRIVRIDLDTKSVSSITTKTGGSSLGQVMGLAIDPTHQFLYASDHADHGIKLIELSTGKADTWVGGGCSGYADDVGVEAQFRKPTGLVRFENYLYVADTGNNLIRRIDIVTGVATTVGGSVAHVGLAVATASADGSGSKGLLCGPTCVVVYGKGKLLLVTDRRGSTLRKLDLNSKKLTTVCGVAGDAQRHNGPKAVARLMAPTGVSVSNDEKHAYITDPLSFQVNPPHHSFPRFGHLWQSTTSCLSRLLRGCPGSTN